MEMENIQDELELSDDEDALVGGTYFILQRKEVMHRQFYR